MAETTYIEIQNPKETLPVVLRCYGKNYLQKQWYYKTGAAAHHLFYCLEGKGRVETQNNSIEIKKGDFWFYKKNMPIKYYPLENSFINNYINFDGQGTEMLLNHYSFPDILVFNSEKLKKQFMSIFEYIENDSEQDRVSADIYYLLVEMGKLCNVSAHADWFDKVIQNIKENYYKDISMKDIATFAGVSESALFKRFKKELNTTPILYINSIRINLAKRYLLNEPNLSIEEISKNVGFTSRCYFTKCFKEKVGVTPTQYKKRP